jgi:hypothetical protein
MKALAAERSENIDYTITTSSSLNVKPHMTGRGPLFPHAIAASLRDQPASSNHLAANFC